MLEKVWNTIVRRRLLRGRDRVVVGVSGGADSIALLHALHALGHRAKIELMAAHLNHGIRGSEADIDEEFVRLSAWRLGVACMTDREDVPARARVEGESLEMAGRAARLRFFARVAEAFGADAVAVAHTADDAAETFLLRLLRGSGTAGLGGLAAESRIGGVRLVRPLIDVTRAEVEAFLRAHRIPWREDMTNRDLSIPRNRMRIELIPLLERHYQPRIREILVRTAEAVRADAELLEPQIRRAFSRAREADGLSVRALASLPPALRRHVFARWLRAGGVDPSRIDARMIERLDDLVQREARAADLADGLVARVRQGLLEMGYPNAPKPAPAPASLPIPGSVRWGGFRVRAELGHGILRPPRGRAGAFPAEASIRLPAADEQLSVAAPWPGARIAPVGLAGSVKLQDLFVNHRVPSTDRKLMPLVVCGSEVVWVPGYRVAQRWAVPEEGAICVHLKADRGESDEDE